MFEPSQADVRRFFCGVYAKLGQQAELEPIEVLAGQWIDRHPEYHAELADLDAALLAMQGPGQGQVQMPPRDNPFLHLSMHLSISEQCSIDQPPGGCPAAGRSSTAR